MVDIAGKESEEEEEKMRVWREELASESVVRFCRGLERHEKEGKTSVSLFGRDMRGRS